MRRKANLAGYHGAINEIFNLLQDGEKKIRITDIASKHKINKMLGNLLILAGYIKFGSGKGTYAWTEKIDSVEVITENVLNEHKKIDHARPKDHKKKPKVDKVVGTTVPQEKRKYTKRAVFVTKANEPEVKPVIGNTSIDDAALLNNLYARHRVLAANQAKVESAILAFGGKIPKYNNEKAAS